MTEKQILRGCELFRTLSVSEFEELWGHVSEKRYEAGASVFQQGESADELFVVAEGRVALQIALNQEGGQSSRGVSVDIVTEKGVLGWSALVEPYIYTLRAVCLQEVKLLCIGANDLRLLLDDNPGMFREVLKGLVKVLVSRLEETRRLLISERLPVVTPR